MIAIAAVDKNWAIGRNNELLVHIPADQKFFRETTSGHTVVMGRKTLESFPGGRPLPNRRNVVLSANPDFRAKDVDVVRSMDELKKTIADCDPDDVFLIGGGSLYKALLPQCSKAYITYIDQGFDADTYFPDLDEDPEWELAEESEEMTYFDLIYHFRTYVKK